MCLYIYIKPKSMFTSLNHMYHQPQVQYMPIWTVRFSNEALLKVTLSNKVRWLFRKENRYELGSL